MESEIKADLEEHYQSLEKWVLSTENYDTFYNGLRAAGGALATVSVKHQSPYKIFLLFLYNEVLLTTLVEHQDNPPFYSFRKYFLDNMREAIKHIEKLAKQVHDDKS